MYRHRYDLKLINAINVQTGYHVHKNRRGTSHMLPSQQTFCQTKHIIIKFCTWIMSNKLSDSELRHKLQELGCTPGPITDGTRNLYLRKLASLSQVKKDNQNISHAPKKQSLPSQPKIVARGGSLQDDSNQTRPVTPPLDDESPPPNYSAVFPHKQGKDVPAISQQTGTCIDKYTLPCCI